MLGDGDEVRESDSAVEVGVAGERVARQDARRIHELALPVCGLSAGETKNDRCFAVADSLR